MLCFSRLCMVKQIKLSPSTLNIFLDCPRCFWNHFHGKKRPNGIFPSLPSGMDNILKHYFDYYRKKGVVPPEIEEIGAKMYEGPELKDWQSNFRGIQWVDKKTGVLLRGAVDEMLTKDGKLIVLDFKTRGFPLKEDTANHYENQLNTYNFLLKKNGRKVENYGYLLFYHPKQACKGKKCNIEFNTDLVKMKANPSNAEKVFRDAVACLQGKEPKPAKGCEWCKFGGMK